MALVILSITIVVLLLVVMVLLAVVARMKITAKRSITKQSAASVTYTRGNSSASYIPFDNSIPTASKEPGIPVTDNEAYRVAKNSLQLRNTSLNAYTSIHTARLLDSTDEDELYI